jgi:SAM-dependent methyltransferase
MQKREYEALFEAEEKVWWFRAMYLFLGKVLRPYIGDRNFALDVGCGTGGLISRLVQMGHSVVGLDYSATALKFASQRQNSGLLKAEGNKIPFRNNFDLVVCVDVLELDGIDPQSLVEGALRALKPGGYALFVAAAHQWLLSEHDRAVNSTRRYNLVQLRQLFSRPDVKILRSTYLFLSLFPLVALRKLFNPPQNTPIEESRSDVTQFPGVVNTVLYAVCWLEAQLLSVFSMPMGSSALILVQKLA